MAKPRKPKPRKKRKKPSAKSATAQSLKSWLDHSKEVDKANAKALKDYEAEKKEWEANMKKVRATKR